ncbi:MAG: hypothetical protein QCI38_08455 [Candidatus Thermoplasmatota archaeon]|nr:hypothetical protein [Candidatus Thermoplasmatota archaeon]
MGESSGVWTLREMGVGGSELAVLNKMFVASVLSCGNCKYLFVTVCSRWWS